MKLSQLTLNQSFTLHDRKLITQDSPNIQCVYETPKKSYISRFLHQQSASTLARTNSAGPKTFIKRVSLTKNQQPHILSRKSSIKEISSEQDKSHVSPLMRKNCFQKSNRPLMSIDSIKKLNLTTVGGNKRDNNNRMSQQLDSRSQEKLRYMLQNQKKQQIFLCVNKHNVQQKRQLRQVQTQRKHYYTGQSATIKDNNDCISPNNNYNISNNNYNSSNINNNNFNNQSIYHNNNNKTILPTNYTSVKLFMSTKFRKGIKQKIPVNILAVPESIHEKQTSSSQLSISQVSQNHLLQTVLASKKRVM